MCTYDLNYNDYNSNISDGLRSLLATSDISDITLAVEGKFFKAHQVILSLFSPYFRELFCVNPSKHTIFFMKNVKYRIMRDLLAFMYEGKVQIPEEDFNLFWETANELKIRGLSNDCEPPRNNEAKHVAHETTEVNQEHERNQSIPQTIGSCLKRQVESVESREEDINMKKSKIATTLPAPSFQGVSVGASKVAAALSGSNSGFQGVSAGASTSWAPVAQENVSMIVNVSGETGVGIKQEIDSYPEENESMQADDVNDLDDTSSEVKWEPQETPMENLMVPFCEMGVGKPGIHETQNVCNELKMNSFLSGTINSTPTLSSGLSSAPEQSNIDQKFSYIVERLNALQEQNKQILKCLSPRLGVGFQPFDSPVPLPMQTFADIMTMEEYLKDINNFNSIIRFLASLGGVNTTSSTNLILKRCLTNQNAAEWNFLGKGLKKAFSSLLLCRAVVDAVLKRQPGSSEAEINGHIKVWLKHAPQRLKGMEKKSPNSNLQLA